MTDWETIRTRTHDAAPLIARVGLALVFLYFGLSQLRDPSSFVGWLPPEVGAIPLPSVTIILLNGALEVFFGTLLLLGIYTRLSAAILGVHLLGIAVSMGFTQTSVRDFGLSIATIAIAFYGPDTYSVDWRFRKNTP